MYRYFLARDAHMPKLEENWGTWHAISLGSHGNAGKGWHVLVLYDRHIAPHPLWVAFPKAVDPKTPIQAKVDHTLLTDLGLTGTETTLEASNVFAAITPAFEHP